LKLLDILAKDIPTLNKNRPLLDAINVLEEENIDCICVSDDGKPLGMLSHRDILSKIGTVRLRAVAPESLYISGFLRPFPVQISNDTSIRKAAKLMLELSAPSLPVFSGDTFLGLIYKRDMLRFVKDSTVSATSILRKHVPLLRSYDRVIHARKLLLDQKLSIIPVVNDDGRPVGIVTEKGILKALIEFHKYVPEKYQRARIRQLTISSSMVADAPVLEEEISLGEVSKMILEEKLPGIIFCEPSLPKIIGILTHDEILDYIVHSFPEEQ